MLIVFVFAATIAIMLYTQVPRYAFEAERQKEQLLVDRGEQYQRAIQLYVRKLKKYPASLDDLEKSTNIRFLRRRYKDPMTNSDEWRLIHVTGGQLTDSLVKKPGATDPNKSTYQNTFITEGPSFGSTNPSNQAKLPPGGALRQSDLAGAPGQMPPPGSPAGTGQQFAGGIMPGGGYQPSQPGQPQYPYPAGAYNPQTGQTNRGQLPAYPNQQYPGQQYQPPGYPTGQVNPPAGGQQAIPSFPLVPGQQTIAGQPLPQQPYQPFQPPGQQGYNPQGYPGNPQPGAGYGLPVPASTYPTSAANSQNSGFGSSSMPGQQPQLGAPGAMSGSAANLINDLLTKPRAGGMPGAAGAGGQIMGTGIAGVASKYEGEGIKIYNDSNLIQEWEFIYDPAKDKANNPAGAVQGQLSPNQQQNQSPFGGTPFGGSSTPTQQPPTQGGFGQQQPPMPFNPPRQQ
jgi:type II secretory pathway pseudopilin PulG